MVMYLCVFVVCVYSEGVGMKQRLPHRGVPYLQESLCKSCLSQRDLGKWRMTCIQQIPDTWPRSALHLSLFIPPQLSGVWRSYSQASLTQHSLRLEYCMPLGFYSQSQVRREQALWASTTNRYGQVHSPIQHDLIFLTVHYFISKPHNSQSRSAGFLFPKKSH